jgi:anti-anti-sigma regulatory factor
VTFVQLDLGGLGRIDYSGALVLRNVVDDLTAAEVEVAVSNPSPRSRRIIDAVFAGAPGLASVEARPT